MDDANALSGAVTRMAQTSGTWSNPAIHLRSSAVNSWGSSTVPLSVVIFVSVFVSDKDLSSLEFGDLGCRTGPLDLLRLERLGANDGVVADVDPHQHVFTIVQFAHGVVVVVQDIRHHRE